MISLYMQFHSIMPTDWRNCVGGITADAGTKSWQSASGLAEEEARQAGARS